MLHLLGRAVDPMVGLGYGWWGGGIHHATFKSRQTWGRGVVCLVQMRMGMVAWPLHQASWLCFFLCLVTLNSALEL